MCNQYWPWKKYKALGEKDKKNGSLTEDPPGISVGSELPNDILQTNKM